MFSGRVRLWLWFLIPHGSWNWDGAAAAAGPLPADEEEDEGGGRMARAARPTWSGPSNWRGSTKILISGLRSNSSATNSTDSMELISAFSSPNGASRGTRVSLGGRMVDYGRGGAKQ